MKLFQTFMLVEFALQGCNHHSKQNITLFKAGEFYVYHYPVRVISDQTTFK